MANTRVQVALNVDDLAEAIAFYARMFDVAPHKVRGGYANFAVEDPPLKLVLIENAGAAERLNHLGVEAPTPEHVSAALSRFRDAGFGDHGGRAGRVLPRRAGQGVRRRPGRAVGLVGVLQRHRRQPGQPRRCDHLGVRGELCGPGQRVRRLLQLINTLAGGREISSAAGQCSMPQSQLAGAV